MKLDFNLNLSQEQKLIMTQQMQLSIKLLQMPAYDLREYIDKEFSENPMLEGNFDMVQEEITCQDKINYKEMIKYLEFDNYGSQNYSDYGDNEVSPFNFISEKHSLKEYLYEQLCELNENELVKNIAKYIIENLDDRGYLTMSLSDMSKEIHIEIEILEQALEIIQEFEPNGIGARDLKECLKIQLINQGLLDEEIKLIIDEYLDLIADNKFTLIAKKLKISPKKAQDYGDIIKSLEPKPSRGFFTGDEVNFIIPDACIRKIDREYFVITNDNILPKLSISNVYKKTLLNGGDKKTEEYIKEKLNSAMFLIKSIEQRRSTLVKVLEAIVRRQREYFDKGEKYLKPMTLKEIADELGIHESTVSRAIKDKYVLTSIGTIKVKNMFKSGITSNKNGEDTTVINIKNQIEILVSNENKKKPLSDQIICDELNKKGLNISRRTVAKYREELGIKSSSKRKRIE
ncbi:RNA polymerase factor sigma-54 [Clostridium septicum]|uniref:RNA polymerase factor sigma-54 n=1 Tax=Clostridium septicum TaxID=1504 RepID=A0A9N7PIG7_CLOSE|nr:RNA polymerase factor sigma-54 [Clostridium septicum]AYE33690.1 RNA polymerase factor sigma-54 [Clostridium septicum]MDU1315356.1 RNA polymerase factor sigma-54 [Clostridium septicum]QAS61845.1 RNA polymerase factor sigma-54 [Clostridium septicum]UEC21699.1 RNA polymerase factor sigma-54 [Clostridium septicum]USS00249.1 RNA polymerase factor sigma-54 [Clostridium septicum]